eukprot:9440598-Pyramimonas_sp.AAC.1
MGNSPQGGQRWRAGTACGTIAPYYTQGSTSQRRWRRAELRRSPLAERMDTSTPPLPRGSLSPCRRTLT